MDWADWSAVAVAVIAAVFVYVQLRHSQSQMAIQAARDFVSQSRQLWADCIREAEGGENGFDVHNFRFTVAQLVGHFEINAICLDELSLSPRVHRMIERTIVDHLDEMIQSGYSPYLKEILFRKHVCPCLKDFCLQRLRLFEYGPSVMEAMNIDRCRWA